MLRETVEEIPLTMIATVASHRKLTNGVLFDLDRMLVDIQSFTDYGSAMRGSLLQCREPDC